MKIFRIFYKEKNQNISKIIIVDNLYDLVPILYRESNGYPLTTWESIRP